MRTLSGKRLEQLQHVAKQLQLASGAINNLGQLSSYDIVLIVNDASSMNNPAHEGNTDSDGVPMTRWDELRTRVEQILDVAICLDSDGIDIYFLNRPSAFNVTNKEHVLALFEKTPSGSAPLSAVYQKVLTDKLQGKTNNKVLLLVATDGEPDRVDEHGICQPDLDGFTELLRNRCGFPAWRCPTTIMACTDAERSIGWIRSLDSDERIECFDVVDDFEGEQSKIISLQGRNFWFTKGDYLVKTLIGPIVPCYGNLNNHRLSHAECARYLGEDCDPSQNGWCSLM